MLGLISYINFSFSTAHRLCVLYTTIVRSNAEYTSVARNFITSMSLPKLQKVHRKFAIADFL